MYAKVDLKPCAGVGSRNPLHAVGHSNSKLKLLMLYVLATVHVWQWSIYDLGGTDCVAAKRQPCHNLAADSTAHCEMAVSGAAGNFSPIP